MNNEKIKEDGQAGMIVELKDGIISVYHTEGHHLLTKWVGSGNDWEIIWDLFNVLKGRENKDE